MIVRHDEPPSPGVWAGRGDYYRIELEDYFSIEPPLLFKTFSSNYAEGLRDEMENYSPKFYPFTISGGLVKLNQGMYLTEVTSSLYTALLEAFGVEATDIEPAQRKAAHEAYAEGERRKRESAYFVRNAKLALEAKRHHKFTCQICGFCPADIYGSAFSSAGIECHHLDPLSERLNFKRTSTLEDVTVLCSNCHRLIHSRRPSLGLQAARRLFKKWPFGKPLGH